MNSFAVIAFFACVAAANADGLYHGSSGHILQGPSSKTTVVGPDGSVIKAVAPGGQIIHEEQPGFVAKIAPVHETPIYKHEAPIYRHETPIYKHVGPVYKHEAPAVSYASHSQVVHYAPHRHEAPVYRHEAPIYRHAAPIYRHEAPIYRHATPIYKHVAPVYKHEAPAVSYASQSQIVRHVPSITYGAPVVHAAPAVAYGAPLAHAYEHEGQYAHDYSETLSDDGSYKPHLYY